MPDERTLTIHRLQRMNNSGQGNPRWMVTFTDGTEAETQADAAVNYGLDNPEYRRVPLVVTFSPAGRITHVRIAPATQRKARR